MDLSAKGAKEAGGKTFGHIVKSMHPKANKNITTTFNNADLFLRLRGLIQNSKAYIFFHGGIGTYTELLLALDYRRKLKPEDQPKIILFGDKLKTFLMSLGDIATNGETSNCHCINTIDELNELI